MRRFLPFFAGAFLVAAASVRAANATNDYSTVDAIFTKYCIDCHVTPDPDAKLVLDSFDGLMKGSENGPVVIAGKSSDSIVARVVDGTFERDGKKIVMPPKKRAKLKADEIALLKSWIDAGAHPPAVAKAIVTELNVPKIPTKGRPRNPINDLLQLPGTNLLAVARYQSVELYRDNRGKVVRKLSGMHGNVNSLAATPDGKRLFAGSGANALFGEITEWNPASGKLLKTFLGHKDAVYAVAISPDGKILASGSYDQKIILWDTGTGKELKTLKGHNGCIFGLAFRPDGKILASASGDHTVKLWNVATGERTDTLSQPLKEVFTVAFTGDGQKLAAAGVDNRIRIWQISPSATETTDPLLDSKFAAEGAILRLVYSPDGKLLLSSADDGTVRLWDAVNMKENLQLEKQPDWPSGLAFTDGGKGIAVGRMDGSLKFYDLSGKKATPAIMAAPMTEKPSITRLWPRGMQLGTTVTVKLSGANLAPLTGATTSNPKLHATPVPAVGTNAIEAWLNLRADADLPRGEYTVTVSNKLGESNPVKLYIGHLPHVFEAETNQAGAIQTVSLAVSYWGELNPGGDMDVLAFHALRGQTLDFDLAAKSIASKADAVLTLLDGDGHILALQGDYESGDPLLIYAVTNDGNYRIQITESTDQGSPDFYYRLTMGELPQVISVFPPIVQTNANTEIRLIGCNLGDKDHVTIHPVTAGEITVPLPPSVYRSRRDFKVMVTDQPVIVHSPRQTNSITIPATACGRIPEGGSDIYRFDAKAGERLIIETDAARRSSPVDTKIEVLYPNGAKVKRLQLRAVRDSAINFRGIDSDFTEIRLDNWQEMELNQYLYMQGEVCRFFRAPRGPDSGFEVYSVGGRRRDYFDTSPEDHALDEICYIVEPHAPDEVLSANGLPVFPLYYENDDDCDRQLGTDSRLHFTAPTNGAYLLRVTDSRGRGGPRFFYQLTVREAKPDFSVTLNGGSPTLNPGSGREFSVTANRADQFDGAIRVDISGVPKGFRISTPVVIEAGHTEATGTINCDTNAIAPDTNAMAKIKVTATAMVDGKEVVKPVNSFDKIAIGGAAQLLVECEPYDAMATNYTWRSVAEKPLEVTLAPGQIVPIWIKVLRRGHDDLATFSGENLPHGVIIDNIGLNGVLIPKEESRRQIFLHSEGWVPDTDRLFFIKAAQAGEPTSLPVLLHIRRGVTAAR